MSEDKMESVEGLIEKSSDANIDIIEVVEQSKEEISIKDITQDELADDNESVIATIENEVAEEIDFAKLMKRKCFSLFLKRSFDICASFFGLLLLTPVLLIVSLIIGLGSKGGVFFRQTRVGKKGREFKIMKFRTMVVNAEAQGLQITVGKDTRITSIGRILRKTKMDELPQLFNVLIGQMSLVGPRPEVPKYVAMYTEYQRNILRVRPGITELSSIVYRDESEVLAKSDDPEQTYINEVMQKKLDLNMQYMQKLGLFYDIKLIFKTFLVLLK